MDISPVTTEIPSKPAQVTHSENVIDIDAAAEWRLRRKMDMRIIPLLFSIYLLSILDRSNIGNAKIAGMSEDLHFSANGNSYSWLLTIFYISYILHGPLVLCWKMVPPHIWVATMLFGWGLMATLQSVATSWSAMMVLRFLLAAFETGFVPGAPFYLSFFYLRREIGLRVGLIFSSGPLSTCFSGALAYGITSGHHTIANWRLLFLVEGLPCFIMAVVAWFYIPDSPSTACFLSEGDKIVARARQERRSGGEESETKLGSIVWSDLGVGLLDIKNYLTAMMVFSGNVSFSSLPVFLPTILNEMGFSAVTAQGLSAPPYFVSFLVVLASTLIADHHAQRGFAIILLSLVGATGYIILAVASATSVRYFAVFLAAAGTFPAVVNVMPWVLNNQGSDTKRGAGVVLLTLIGQCGPLLGTRIYPATDKPYYRMGMWTCASFMVFTAFLAMSLRIFLVRENRKLDRKYGPLMKGEDGNVAAVENENDGPSFRYVL